MINAGFNPIRKKKRQPEYDDQMEKKVDVFNPDIRMEYECNKFNDFG